MALSFTPQYHVQTEPGIWHKPLDPFAPFGKYPSMDEIKRVSEEAAKIESEGEKVITMVFDLKGDFGR